MWPGFQEEFKFSQANWDCIGFPSNALREEVYSPVNTDVWFEKMGKLSGKKNGKLMELLKETGEWLVNGVSNHVSEEASISTSTRPKPSHVS